MTTSDPQKAQRQLALERLKVREEMRSVDLEEDTAVIEKRALERVGQQAASPQQSWLNAVLELIKQVPPAHKVIVVFPIVLFTLYVIGWQLGVW